MRGTFAKAVALLLWMNAALWAQQATPVPTPPYMIVGAIGEYTNNSVSSRRSAAGDLLHGTTYRTTDRTRDIRVGVREATDGRWLLHEIERYVREIAQRERPGQQPYVRKVHEVGGQLVVYFAHATGRNYFWVSGTNKEVRIESTRVQINPDGTQQLHDIPESFVATYLERLPSDLSFFEFDARREEQWIRNEFDRRFYYVALLSKLAGSGPADG